MKTFDELLINLHACEEAKAWAQGMTVEQAVSSVERGDWLLWLAKKIDIPKRPLTLAKARCAKTVIHLMKDERSINAVNLAEEYGLSDEVSEDDLRKAAAAAYAATYAAAAAAYAATYDAASAAAYAATYAAAAAAYTATYAAAADAASDAAYAAADDAYAAADDALSKNQLQTAEICREVLGKMIIARVNELLTN